MNNRINGNGNSFVHGFEIISHNKAGKQNTRRAVRVLLVAAIGVLAMGASVAVVTVGVVALNHASPWEVAAGIVGFVVGGYAVNKAGTYFRSLQKEHSQKDLDDWSSICSDTDFYLDNDEDTCEYNETRQGSNTTEIYKVNASDTGYHVNKWRYRRQHGWGKDHLKSLGTSYSAPHSHSSTESPPLSSR